MARRRILLDVRVIKPLVTREPIDTQALLLLLLCRIGELSPWICSSQLSVLLAAVRKGDDASHPRKSAAVCGMMDYMHVAMAGEADVRAVCAAQKEDLNEALLRHAAHSHRALAIVGPKEPATSTRNRTGNCCPAGAEAHMDVEVLSARGLFDLLEKRYAVSYALVTS